MAKSSGANRPGTRAGKSGYIPDAGDLIWLTFTPQAGREQMGRRPALVLTPLAYNRATSLCIVCPITSQIKVYPFEVVLPHQSEITGVVLADHLRSANWNARQAVFAGKVDEEILNEVKAKLGSLLGW